MSTVICRWGQLAGLLFVLAWCQAEEQRVPRLKAVYRFNAAKLPRGMKFSNGGKFLVLRSTFSKGSRLEYRDLTRAGGETIRVCEEKGSIAAAGISEPYEVLVYVTASPASIRTRRLGVDMRFADKNAKPGEYEWSKIPKGEGQYRQLLVAPNGRNATAIYESPVQTMIHCFDLANGKLLREMKVKKRARLLEYAGQDSSRILLSGGQILNLVDETVVDLRAMMPLPELLSGSLSAKHFAAKGTNEIVGLLQLARQGRQDVALGIWDAKSGRFLRTAFETLGTAPWDFKVTPSGKHVVFLTAGQLGFFPLSSDQREFRIDFGTRPERHDLSADCRKIATVNQAGQVTVYALAVSSSKTAESGSETAGGPARKSGLVAKRKILDWPLRRLPPYPCLAVARAGQTHLGVGLQTLAPRLIQRDNAPAWIVAARNIFVRFPLATVSCYRGSGGRINAAEIPRLLREERYVFLIPNGIAHPAWTRHLRQDAIVVRLPAPSADASYPKLYYREMAGVGETRRLVAHAFPRVEPLILDRPRFQTRKYVYRMTARDEKDELAAQSDPNKGKGSAKERAFLTLGNYRFLPTFDATRLRRPSDYTRGGKGELRFHRVSGKRIYPLTLVTEAMHKGSVLVLDGDELFVPEMLSKVLQPDTIILLRRKSRGASRIDRNMVELKLTEFERLLHADDIKKAREVLLSLPVTSPAWPGYFYQLASFQHHARKTDEAKQSLRIAALLEWETELTDWAKWRRKLFGLSSKWVTQQREALKGTVGTFKPPRADFPSLPED